MDNALGFYRMVLNHVNDGVYFVDVNRNITFWNTAAEKISGYSEEEVLHKPCFWNLLMHQDEEGVQFCEKNCPILKTMSDGLLREDTMFFKHKQGYRVPVSVRVFPIRSPSRQIVGAVQIFADMSLGSEHSKKMKALATLAYFDLVTGLANRRYIESRIGIMLNEYKKTLSPFGLLLINIVGFKAINDRYGPEIGDQILRSVARGIASEVGPADIAGRWDGTRFVVIVPNTKRALMILLAEKIKGVASQAANSLNSEDALLLSISIAGTLNYPEDSPLEIQRRLVHNMQESEMKNNTFVMDEM